MNKKEKKFGQTTEKAAVSSGEKKSIINLNE